MPDFLEYPLPSLSVDTDFLLIETKDRHEGKINIKNTGGSLLSGKIFSKTGSLVFEPDSWEGNDVSVSYRFVPDAAEGWKPGDEFETCAIISSNGGEKKIPVSIRLTQMAIATKEGVTVANVRDFYEYALRYPAQARRIFTDGEFYMLLLATGYEYMEIYEMLHKDLNRERSMDNFFILSGLKNKTGLSLPKKTVEFARKPYDNAMVYGNFLAQKTDAGYFEAPVFAANNSEWLKLSSERIISSDFNEANAAMVKFTIDPLRIHGRYASETVYIGNGPSRENDNAVEIVFKRLDPLVMRLNREAFRFEDRGMVEVVNNTGTDLLVELFCKDTFVRFPARKFHVGERNGIPFEIKLSAFMAAQLLFRKLPFIRTAIEVRTSYRDVSVRRELPLSVGEW